MRRVLLTLLLMASAAHAENWLQIAKFDSKGVLLLDTESVDRSSDLRKATLKSVYPIDRPIGPNYRGVAADARSYRWESIVARFNCRGQTLAIAQSILHSADDQVVGRIEPDESALEYRIAARGSIGAIMLDAVCDSATSDAGPKPPLARITRPANPDHFYPLSTKSRGGRGSPIVNVCVGPTWTRRRSAGVGCHR